MNRHIFEVYAEKELAPSLKEGGIVIMDNLAAHTSPAAETAIRARGAWVLFLCGLFQPEECQNYFKVAGYGFN